MKKIREYPISELSFIVFTNGYKSNLKNEAYAELKRRFSLTGFTFDAFAEYEQEVINVRGIDINKYLIKENPSAQDVMELYFNLVANKELHEHEHLLLSEVLLCNDNVKRTFFTKMLKIELKNIKRRIASRCETTNDIDTLQNAYNILEKRYNKKQEYWYENSIIDALLDFEFDGSSYETKKRKEKNFALIEKSKDSKIALYRSLIYEVLFLDNDYLDALNRMRIASIESSKLSPQKKSIITSFKRGSYVNYDFINNNVKEKVKSINKRSD